MGLIKLLDTKFYPDYKNNWDDDIFRDKILKNIRKNDVVLDLGAGAGIIPQMDFRKFCDRVYGIDPDPRVENNPYLFEGVEAFGEDVPYPDNFFDVVFADNVLEHLSAPETVLNEVYRVLKPGGIFLGKTPNKFHYMPLISRLTPTSFHKWYNQLRGRDAEDTFPTCYLINCSKDFHQLCKESSLLPIEVDLIEGRPEYLRMFVLTYVFGILYQRIVSSVNFLRNFRILLIGVAQKPID